MRLCSLIVFAETGLLVGFFLPGDSLLFTLGVVCAGGDLNLGVVIGLLIVAAVMGDTTGYFLGRGTGPRIFSRPKSRLFNPVHLQETQEFYDKHGGKTLIYARFVPIIRTFAPFMAGVGQMPYSRFISFSVFGGIRLDRVHDSAGIQLGPGGAGAEVFRLGGAGDYRAFADACDSAGLEVQTAPRLRSGNP